MTKFTKMVATGNDFIMIDNRRNTIKNRKDFARKYCQRHFSIGADGVIFIEKSLISNFRMRIFNPDGSEAEMCGNGARCTAMFAYLKHIVDKSEMKFQTLAGIISAIILKNRVKIGIREPNSLELHKKLKIGGENFTVHYLNTGVPHAILIRKDIDKIDIMKIAPPIRYHKMFPRGTNVDFVQVINSHKIKMRTYERGIESETFACGTGAVAAATISSFLGYTKPPVDVVVKGGILKINFKLSPVRDVFLEGEAKIIYEGEIADEK